VRAVVLDRREWVDSNLLSMRNMLDPLMQRFGERMANNPFAPIGRRVAATELGVLLGYVAQRVLGQYDLLVPDDRGEAVYYVGANVLALEKRFAFRPRDFRLWIAIHEVTHRAQFVGVPWMRDYFLGLVQQVFELVDPDPRTLARALSNAVEAIRRGQNPLDEGGLVSLIATPEQRGVLGQVQALMSVTGTSPATTAWRACCISAARSEASRNKCTSSWAWSRRCASTRSGSASCAGWSTSAVRGPSTRPGSLRRISRNSASSTTRRRG